MQHEHQLIKQKTMTFWVCSNLKANAHMHEDIHVGFRVNSSRAHPCETYAGKPPLSRIQVFCSGASGFSEFICKHFCHAGT